MTSAERVEQQGGAFRLGPHVKPHGLRFLVVDDLYQTGASAEAVPALLLGLGQAAEVFYLAITKTRTRPA